MKKILKRERKIIILFSIFSFLLGMIEVSFATIIQVFIDSLQLLNVRLFIEAIFLFIIFLIFNFIFNRFVIFSQSELTKRIHMFLKMNLLKYFLSLNYDDFVKTSIGEKINYFEYKLAMIEQYYFDNIWCIIQTSILLVVATLYLLLINPIICGIVVILGVVSMILPLYLGDKLNYLISKNIMLSDDCLHSLKEIFQGMIVIKVFQRENDFCKYFKDKLLSFEKSSQIMNNKNGEYNQINGIFQYVVLISCFSIGGFLVMKGELSLSKMIAITQVSNLIVTPIQQIGASLMDMKASKTMKNELSKILLKSYNLSNTKKGNINFESLFIRVSSSHKQGKNILGKLKLCFKKGKKYCIIGENGSGKSTIGFLLLNLLNKVDAEVVLNGKKVSFEEISEMISYVPQEGVVFNNSLDENITLFELFSKEEVDNVKKIVGLEKFREINQEISENGTNISGGELKKVTIARALIRNRPIMLLDEFEASLDEKSVKYIVEKLLASKKCIICISHNLNKDFLKRFDSIIFIKKGEVKGCGKYDELIKANIEFKEYVLEENEVHNG